MEEEKEKLIQSINEIRSELSLGPYPSGYLESKDVEELKKLYSAYFRMREESKEKLKEGLRLRISLKSFVLVGIFGGVVFSLFFLYPKLFGLEERTETLQTQQPFKNESLKIVSFFVQSSFKLPDNTYALIIQNNGTENITFSKILADDENVQYEVFAGSYPPLFAGETVYLKLFKSCDGLTHTLEIITENKTLKTELQAC